MPSVLAICLLLTICQYSESSEEKSLLLFPIQSTPHMVYLDKKTRPTIRLNISCPNISLNGKQFMASLQSGKFSLGQQIQDDTEHINQKVTEAPPLPMHGTFIVRKRDSNNNIKISIDWNKEYLVSKGQRPTSFAMQIIFYNFKGDYLGTSNVTKPTSNTSDIVTSFSPKSQGQQYNEGTTPDAHDILVAVLRTGTNNYAVVSNVSTYFIIYPDLFAEQFKAECDWTIDDIVNRQAAFMGMTMLQTSEDWKLHSFKFSFLALLSQAAGMTQTAFNDYKYLSIIKVPKTNSTNETYNLRDIGQRTGAGFGFIYWNRGGHQLSEKFDNKFKAQQILNNTLFKEFVVKCFEYGELLDPRTSEEKTNGTTVNYRNKEGNDNWSYQFEGQTLIGNRTMEANNQVKQISWTWESDNWNTNADGTVKTN